LEQAEQAEQLLTLLAEILELLVEFHDSVRIILVQE
jgi:hypothetical protein